MSGLVNSLVIWLGFLIISTVTISTGIHSDNKTVSFRPTSINASVSTSNINDIGFEETGVHFKAEFIQNVTNKLVSQLLQNGICYGNLSLNTTTWNTTINATAIATKIFHYLHNIAEKYGRISNETSAEIRNASRRVVELKGRLNGGIELLNKTKIWNPTKLENNTTRNNETVTTRQNSLYERHVITARKTNYLEYLGQSESDGRKFYVIWEKKQWRNAGPACWKYNMTVATFSSRNDIQIVAQGYRASKKYYEWGPWFGAERDDKTLIWTWNTNSTKRAMDENLFISQHQNGRRYPGKICGKIALMRIGWDYCYRWNEVLCECVIGSSCWTKMSESPTTTTTTSATTEKRVTNYASSETTYDSTLKSSEMWTTMRPTIKGNNPNQSTIIPTYQLQDILSLLREEDCMNSGNFTNAAAMVGTFMREFVGRYDGILKEGALKLNKTLAELEQIRTQVQDSSLLNPTNSPPLTDFTTKKTPAILYTYWSMTRAKVQEDMSAARKNSTLSFLHRSVTEDYKRFYVLWEEELVWKDADTACWKYNMTLATITNLRDITSIRDRYYASHLFEEWGPWLGGRKEIGRNWTWDTIFENKKIDLDLFLNSKAFRNFSIPMCTLVRASSSINFQNCDDSHDVLCQCVGVGSKCWEETVLADDD